MRLLQVATVYTDFWLDKITRKSCHGSYVIYCKKSLPWAGKARATCTDFVAKRRPTLYYLQQRVATCNNLICYKTGWWVVKRATSLLNSIRSHGTKQVARFCCPFYRTLRKQLVSSLVWSYQDVFFQPTRGNFSQSKGFSVSSFQLPAYMSQCKGRI